AGRRRRPPRAAAATSPASPCTRRPPRVPRRPRTRRREHGRGLRGSRRARPDRRPQDPQPGRPKPACLPEARVRVSGRCPAREPRRHLRAGLGRRHLFYVMEFVPGRHFLEHVRASAPGPARDKTVMRVPAARSPALRPALVQLARGIHALHRANRLHRDVKSSNVLVTADGRVKLLDYGLVAELDVSQAYAQLGLVGTVGYMSPEQCGSRPLAPASDWYSFGILLYEALTGGLPFRGAFLDVLSRKQNEEPPPPAAVASWVPDDLNVLCAELLRIDPAARPTGEEILRRLGAGPSPPSPPPEDLLVGRDRHLAALRDAVAAVRRSGA